MNVPEAGNFGIGVGWGGGWGVKRCAGCFLGGARCSQQQTDLFLCLRSSFLLRFKLRELRRDEREHNHTVRNFKAAPAKFVKGHLRQKYIVLLFFFFFCTYLCLDFLEVYLENRPKVIFAILFVFFVVFFPFSLDLFLGV